GYTLFSDEAGKLMTIIADTCGVHDMIAGACSRFTNAYRYGDPAKAGHDILYTSGSVSRLDFLR
ncbi:MAG: DUF1989 domain-containing protein, partial [Candidatus Tectomicrobia bacterium]